MWRKVQVERPRASTSGGQSGGRVGVFRVGVVVVVREEGERVGEEVVEVSFFVMASQEATEVQERQLFGFFLLEICLFVDGVGRRTVCHLCPARRP